MAKFYVKITDEVPTVDEKALWFEIDSEKKDSKEFFVLGRNEYNTMYNEFVQAKDNLKKSDILTNAIDNLMSDESFRVPLANRSESADKLINPANPNNQEQKFTWSSLTSRFNNIASTLADKVSSEQLSSTVASLTSLIDGKSPKNHAHTNLKPIVVSDHCELVVNEATRVCQFSYYYQDISMTAGKVYDWNILGNSKYKPYFVCKLSTLHSGQVAQLTKEGHLKFSSTQTGTQNMYFGGTYIY